MLHRAFGHRAHVWILLLAERSEASTRDFKSLLAFKAIALLPKGSLVLNPPVITSAGLRLDMTHGIQNIPRRYGDLGALIRDEPWSARPRSNVHLETGTTGERTSIGQRNIL